MRREDGATGVMALLRRTPEARPRDYTDQKQIARQRRKALPGDLGPATVIGLRATSGSLGSVISILRVMPAYRNTHLAHRTVETP